MPEILALHSVECRLHMALFSEVSNFNPLFYMYTYVIASIKSHWTTMEKSQQYMYHTNNTNKMHRSNTNIPQSKVTA